MEQPLAEKKLLFTLNIKAKNRQLPTYHVLHV